MERAALRKAFAFWSRKRFCSFASASASLLSVFFGGVLRTIGLRSGLIICSGGFVKGLTTGFKSSGGSLSGGLTGSGSGCFTGSGFTTGFGGSGVGCGCGCGSGGLTMGVGGGG